MPSGTATMGTKRPSKRAHAADGSPADDRITWFRGTLQAGPRQTIGVLELRADGAARVVFAERAEVDARCHIRLARLAWGPKTSLETRWWSLVLGQDQQIHTVRNGSCSDPLNTADVPLECGTGADEPPCHVRKSSTLQADSFRSTRGALRDRAPCTRALRSLRS